MKCMKSTITNTVVRVTNETAEVLKPGGFVFVPKAEWKKATRTADTRQSEAYYVPTQADRDPRSTLDALI